MLVNEKKLAKKVALITGASRGIGREIALLFAKNGADIAFFYNSNKALAEETFSLIKDVGRNAYFFKVDVSSKSQVDAAVKDIVSLTGKVDILVNNAGIVKDNLLLRMSEEDWDNVLNVNLKGAFLCTKAVLRSMLKQKEGRIINISSVVGKTGNIGQANYVSSKAGLIGFTKAMSKELAAKSITVNALAPGFIKTDMTTQLDEETKNKILAQIPLGRFGDPLDVASAALFLASKDASYITGQTLYVDGGLSL